MTRRVIYIVDHKAKGGQWRTPSISTTVVENTGDAAAEELAERIYLCQSYVAQRGWLVRLRVWSEPGGLTRLLDFDADAEAPEGEWTYQEPTR